MKGLELENVLLRRAAASLQPADREPERDTYFISLSSLLLSALPSFSPRMRMGYHMMPAAAAADSRAAGAQD